MDELCERFHHSRREMIDAFVDLSDRARRAGVAEADISAAHGRFFDGNVEVKDSFRVVALLARVWRPQSGS